MITRREMYVKETKASRRETQEVLSLSSVPKIVSDT